MTFKVIRGQGQGQEMTSVPFRDYFCRNVLETITTVLRPLDFVRDYLGEPVPERLDQSGFTRTRDSEWQ